MRRYLVGETPLPSDMAVIVMVSCDEESVVASTIRLAGVESDSHQFQICGTRRFFRVMMGYQMWPALREASCTSRLQPIWFGNCERLLDRCKVVTRREAA